MAKFIPIDEAREQACVQVALSAAREGIILLKNENEALPLAKAGKEKVAVFGIGQIYTVKGGTGSGDVNNKYTVNILDGLKKDPDLIVDDALAAKYTEYTQTHPNMARATFLSMVSNYNEEMPVDPADYKDNDCAVYVITRIAGEASDLANTEGQYLPTSNELALLGKIRENFKKVIVVLNVMGVIDTKDLDAKADAVVMFGYCGQEGGTALADILTAKAIPSGKTSDTWAYNYEDYPSAANFGNEKKNGRMNPMFFGQGMQEQNYVNYEENIYVGYRYFDTFGKDVLYPFGFGLSYTDFEIADPAVSIENGIVTVSAAVTNTGSTYAGKEVIQVYVSAPEVRLEKPYQELKGFAKTAVIAPGETDTVTINIPVTELASYDEAQAAYILEPGYYYIRVGNCSRNTVIAGALCLDQEVVTKRLKNLTFKPGDDFTLMSNKAAVSIAAEGEAEAKKEAEAAALAIDAAAIETAVVSYREPGAAAEMTGTETGLKIQDVVSGKCTMEAFIAQFSDEELIQMVCGVGMDLSGIAMDDDDKEKGEDDGVSGVIGSVSLSVAGAAGESYDFTEKYGIRPMVLCDGPAGVRITRLVTNEEGQTYEQNCTAYPVGTMLASTWNMQILDEVGEAVSKEMLAYDVDLWLAPGMNIHRNPLCGRNFEYYAEDPLVSGNCAAAITRGVQRNGTAGVTIKHFCMNNMEVDRTNSNSIVPERAFREIYLKNFEIAVTEADPWSIMTSYNDINGTPAADNYENITQVARDEWNFNGFVMTDWGGGISQPGISMYAGNDMIQPGGEMSRGPLRETLAAGHAVSRGANELDVPVTRALLQKSVANILKIYIKTIKFTGRTN